MARDVEARAAVTLAESPLSEMSKNERIKVASQGLFYVDDGKSRHSFLDEVEALEKGESETLGGTAKELSKFFGIYKQQGRGERGKKTDDYFFMVRIRNPGGGRLSPSQWLALDDAAEQFADGTVRITSRQAVQYHHVYGPQLAPLIRHLNRSYAERGTLSACGDVNRNVMASPVDGLDPAGNPRLSELAVDIADALAPRSSAYFQVFVSDEEGRNAGPVNPEEPLYGEQYLPRKFKIGIAHPGDNSRRPPDPGHRPGSRCGGRRHLRRLPLGSATPAAGSGLTHNNPEDRSPTWASTSAVFRREQVVAACRGPSRCIQKDPRGAEGPKARRAGSTRFAGIGVDAVKAGAARAASTASSSRKCWQTPGASGRSELHHGWYEQRGGGNYVRTARSRPCVGSVPSAAASDSRGSRDPQNLGVILTRTAGRDPLRGRRIARRPSSEILDRPRCLPQSDAGFAGARRNAMACPAKPTCGLAMTDAENIIPTYLVRRHRGGRSR